jgi:hypothetical protein
MGAILLEKFKDQDFLKSCLQQKESRASNRDATLLAWSRNFLFSTC